MCKPCLQVLSCKFGKTGTCQSSLQWEMRTHTQNEMKTNLLPHDDGNTKAVYMRWFTPTTIYYNCDGLGCIHDSPHFLQPVSSLPSLLQPLIFEAAVANIPWHCAQIVWNCSLSWLGLLRCSWFLSAECDHHLWPFVSTPLQDCIPIDGTLEALLFSWLFPGWWCGGTLSTGLK